MANCCGGVLAAEVSKAGGLGLVGHAASLEGLQNEVEKGRNHLGLRPDEPLPFGVGLVLWKLESPEVSPDEAASLSSTFLRYVASLAPHSVWLSFSPDLDKWVARYRQAELEAAAVARPGRPRAFVWVMASETRDTLAARAWPGVDVVVAQGTESGGHGASHARGLPLRDLVARVSDRFPPATRPFLVAAGGVSSATTVEAVLSEHASVAGVVAGTAFTVATESLWTERQKALVVRTASGDETDRGLEWDEIRNAMGWPAGVDGRAIRNRTRGRDESLYREGEAAEGGPNLDEVGTWAGTGVGDVQAIRPAAEILEDLASRL
ncbi:hypothetical protein JCM11491_003202 [Sporobolomyces phaffii]